MFRKKKGQTRLFAAAVVPAAGEARRMEGMGKMFATISGITVLGHSLLALEQCPDIDEIVIAAREEDILEVADMCNRLGLSKISKIVKGGENRTHSVYNALMEIQGRNELVAIHDGARPCISPLLISRTLRQAQLYGACAPGVPVADTIKRKNNDGMVIETLNRSELVAVQTPQCFRAALIRGILARAVKENWVVTDDCAAAERYGAKVWTIDGELTNLKITTPIDLQIARAILQERYMRQGGA